MRFVLLSEHVSFIPKNILQSCKLISISRPEKSKYIHRIIDSDEREKIRDVNQTAFIQRINPLIYDKQLTTENTRSGVLAKPESEKLNIRTKFFVSEKDPIKSNTKWKVKQILDCLDTEYIINIKETESFSLMNNGSEIPKDNFNTICNNIIQELLQYHNLSFTKFRDTIYDILVYNLDVPECLWYVISYFIQRNIFTEEEIRGIMDKMYVFLKQYNNNYRPIYHLESILFYIITILQKHKK